MHTPRLVYSNSRINNLLITGFHTANNNNTGSCNLSTVYVLFYFPGGAFSPYKKLAQQVEVLLKKPPQLLRPCYLLSHTCEVFTTRKYAALRTPGSELKKYDLKMAHLLFSCGQVIIFSSSDRTGCEQKCHVRQQAEKQGMSYFKYSSKNAFSFSNGITSI